MFSRKHNQTVGDHGTAAYTNVPVGAGVGGTANYPASQKAGYGYEAGKDVNTQQKAGYVYDNHGNMHPQQSNGHGDGYVATPVSYGPDGTPIVAKKNNRARNLVVGALAVCCCCVAL